MFDIQEVKKNVVKWTSSREDETDNRGNDNMSQTNIKKNTQTSPTTAAIIGPSIHIEGQLTGEEALIIEGRVEGTIDLKNNNLTIGSNGKIQANVFANTIRVEGELNGDLHGKERVHISKTGKVTGNIFGPRVSIEDGAYFRGSIEMDGQNLKTDNKTDMHKPAQQQDTLKRA